MNGSLLKAFKSATGQAGIFAFGIVAAFLAIGIGVGLAAQEQTPAHSYEDLFSVAFARGAVWTVGSKGLVLVSSDEGQNWQRQRWDGNSRDGLRHDLDLLSIRFALEGSTGWIGGENGLIYYTDDGGRKWARRDAPSSEQNIFRVAPINSASACAVGTEGTLLCTTDAGVHWNSRRFDHYIDLNDVTFVGRDGWAVGAYRTILCTNDAGEHWHLQRGGNRMVLDEESYFAVGFKDALHGWVAGLSGEIVYTTDGGATWQQTSPASRPSLFAIGEAWPNIWFGGKRGALFELSPAGNWRQDQISFGDITDISIDGRNGVAVGLGGTILRTTNGGDTWQSVGGE